jgi:hypothetical protein
MKLAQSAGSGQKVNYLKIKIMEDFRFEKLDIWKEAVLVSDLLFDFSDKADEKKLFRLALSKKQSLCLS